MNITESEYCRPEVIASLFGVTVRRIQQLTQDGIIKTVQVKEGGKKVRRYEMVSTIQGYIKHLSDKAHGKEKSVVEVDLKTQKLRAEIALKESQGELHKIKTEIAAGKYMDIETVKLDYSRFFIVFKKFALSLPKRMVGRLNGLCEPTELRSLEQDLTLEIKKQLNDFIVAGERTKDKGDKGVNDS